MYLYKSCIPEVLPAFPGKESAYSGEDARSEGSIPDSRKIPWRREWQPTAVFWPAELHGQKSLVVYVPWDHKELDTTEHACKNIEMVCHSLLQWTTFCQTSSPWPVLLRWPHKTWLHFIELDKAVVLVWLDWLVFCDYSFSVSVLWCLLATPTILLGFLLPWT